MLLESAAKTDPEFLRKVDATTIIARIFEAWSQGSPATEVICKALEKAGLLEFTHCPNRSLLWQKLPTQYLTKSLSNTLRAWLENYYLNAPTKPKLEKELVEILFSPQHRDFTFPRHSPALGLGGLMLIEAWGSERDCESWLSAVTAGSTMLTSSVANRAGKIVTDHHWVNLAKIAKNHDERDGRRDLQPIWKIHYDSLGRLEKFAFHYFPTHTHHSSNVQKSIDTKSMIDAVFVTALPEEFSAICAHLSDRREHTERGTIYEMGRLETDDSSCNVAVVQTGMGNALSAAATERVLNLFEPKFAFFVGIAGGLRDDLNIGDVVAANKVYGYEGGKSGVNFQPRPDAPKVTHEAEQRANAVVRDEIWQERIISPQQNIPTAIVRPIAAGEKVLTSNKSEDMTRLKKTFTDAYAVAMEDHGFATAVGTHPAVCFSVVRGISDLIENKQAADSSGSHEIAANNAAAFSVELLAGLLRGRQQSWTNVPDFLD